MKIKEVQFQVLPPRSNTITIHVSYGCQTDPTAIGILALRVKIFNPCNLERTLDLQSYRLVLVGQCRLILICLILNHPADFIKVGLSMLPLIADSLNALVVIEIWDRVAKHSLAIRKQDTEKPNRFLNFEVYGRLLVVTCEKEGNTSKPEWQG